MDPEKKEFGKWWVWVVVLLAGTVVVFSGLRYVGLVGQTVVERKVFEQSYQKKSADQDAISTYQAQIAVLQGKLNNPDIDAGTKAEIRAQIDAIRILMSSKQN